MINGKKVNLKNIKASVLNIYASEDHLVPPAASIPLNENLTSENESVCFKGGHIGVFVGSKSQKELAPKVVDFLKNRDK